MLEAALRHAARDGMEEVTPVEIMLGLLEAAPDVVARAAVDLEAAAARTRRYGRPGAASQDEPERRPLPDGPLNVFSHTRAMCSSTPSRRRSASGTATSAASTCCSGSCGTSAASRAACSPTCTSASRRLAHASSTSCLPRRTAGTWRASRGQMPFTPRMTHIFSLALREMAVRDGATEVETGDLLLAVERDGEGVAVQVLEQLGAPRPLVRQRTLAALHGEMAPVPAGRLTPSARRALLLADAEASALGHTWVGCEHLLLALTRQEGPAADALASVGVTAGSVLAGLVDLGGSIAFGEPARTPRLVRSIETAEELAARGPPAGGRRRSPAGARTRERRHRPHAARAGDG